MDKLDTDLRCIMAEHDDYRKLRLLAAAFARCLSDPRDAMHVESMIAIEIGKREAAFIKQRNNEN